MGKSIETEGKTKEKKVRIKGKAVKITRTNPDKIKPIFVNDLVVTHSETEFFLTFAVLEAPGILDEKALDSLQQIEAIAVVKLVLTPKFAEAVLVALSRNIDNYKEVIKKNESHK